MASSAKPGKRYGTATSPSTCARRRLPCFNLRWVGANSELAQASDAKNSAAQLVADRTGEQAAAARQQVTAAAALPELRDAEVRAAAALQRLNLAREALEREETRARERMAELNQRLLQLEGDIERERPPRR